MSNADLQFARLAMLTKIDRAKWERIFSSPEDIQRLELQNYADQDWTDPKTPAGQEFLSILGLLGGVGGNVASIVSGGTAVKSVL